MCSFYQTRCTRGVRIFCSEQESDPLTVLVCIPQRKSCSVHITMFWIQRRKPTRGRSVWTQVQQIFFNTSSTTDVLTTCGFSGRFKRCLLTCGDVQPNPGPTTQYPCPVCTRNVTSPGVSYQCHSYSCWVHSKCSDLKDAKQYNRTKDWACKTCSSAPAPPPTKPSPAPTTTSKPNNDMFNILQFNANGIGNKLELECFLEKHSLKVTAIQESKPTFKSQKPRFQNFATVR